MESKQLNRKLNSFFWYLLYSLPLVCFFIGYLSYTFIFKETGVVDNISFISIMEEFNSYFSGFILSFIKDSLVLTFEKIGFIMDGSISSFVVIVLTWFIQMMLVHVIVDVLTFIFNLFHKLMERVF